MTLLLLQAVFTHVCVPVFILCPNYAGRIQIGNNKHIPYNNDDDNNALQFRAFYVSYISSVVKCWFRDCYKYGICCVTQKHAQNTNKVRNCIYTYVCYFFN